jgi:hypothetical protein
MAGGQLMVRPTVALRLLGKGIKERSFLLATQNIAAVMVTSSPSATGQAVTLLGALTGLESRTGDTLSPFHQRLIAERMNHARQRFSQQQWDDAWQMGYGRTPVQLIDDAAQWLRMETPNQPAGSSSFPVG